MEIRSAVLISSPVDQQQQPQCSCQVHESYVTNLSEPVHYDLGSIFEQPDFITERESTLPIEESGRLYSTIQQMPDFDRQQSISSESLMQYDESYYTYDAPVPQQQPKNDSKPKSRGSRRPRKPRPMLLWQFILLLLLHEHSGLAWAGDQWCQRGVFKFTDTNEVARLWGNYKRNRHMSYEKLSRCIRDYFTRPGNNYFGVMQPDGRGKLHKRVHFAFNLDNASVLSFIAANSPSYYSKLIQMGIVQQTGHLNH